MKVSIITWPDSQMCMDCCHGQFINRGEDFNTYLCFWSYTESEESWPLACPLGISLKTKIRKEVQFEPHPNIR